MTINIEMENIGGFTSKKIFKIKEGLNIIEAPNRGGKTSFIKGIRALILPEKRLEKHRDFLNILAKSGKVTLDIDKKRFSRNLMDINGVLSVSGKAMVGDGEKVDSLCIAIRENELFDLVEKGESLKPKLEEFSGSKYYRIASGPFTLKKKLNQINVELTKQRDEYAELKEYQKKLSQLKKKKGELEKKLINLPEIPEADSEAMLESQRILADKNREKGNLEFEIYKQSKIMEERAESIKRKEEEIAIYTKRIEDFNRQHPNVDQEIASIEKEILSLRNKRSEIQREISKINDRLESIKKAQVGESKFKYGICPVCERPLNYEYLKNIEQALLNDYNMKTREVGIINDKLDEKEIELQKIQDELAAVKLGATGAIKMKSDSERRLKDVKREYERAKQTKEELENKLKKIESIIKNIEKEFDPKVVELIRKREQTRSDIKIVESDIERTKNYIIERGKTGEIIQYLDKKRKFLNAVVAYLKREEERRLKEAVDTFNEEAEKIYEILRFMDFERIYIDDYTFEVNVVRKKNGGSIRQPIKSLSASERESIALILMLAGREKFVKDFPLFVLDAISEDYDETRLKSFVNYIKDKVPYVIVTTLSPLETSEEIVIKHSL
jgi:DNA repair exonuclease SbcCD ATPase subunit